MALTSAQIIADALQIAKCPGYTAQGGRALNLVLEDLCKHQNLKVNLESSTITVPAYSNGPFNLEANYLRTYEMVYYVTGLPYFLNQVNLKQYDAEVKTPGLANYPYEFATDLSGVPDVGYGLLYIYPQSGSQLTINHRYFIQRADITTPETSSVVPWFEDQDYLIQAVAMRMMRITDDTRYDDYVARCAMMLERHLFTEGDEQQVVKEIALDPRRFKMKSTLRPTKQYPW